MPFVPDKLYNLAEANFNKFMQRQFARFESYILAESRAKLYTAAPVNPEEGMIVRADGTSWDPGSGRGFYGYDNGSWTFLG